jgi:hypothetical protein
MTAVGRKLTPNLMPRVSVSGTTRPLTIKSWASALEKLLLMDTAKYNFSYFLQNDLAIATKETLKIGSREAENGTHRAPR